MFTISPKSFLALLVFSITPLYQSLAVKLIDGTEMSYSKVKSIYKSLKQLDKSNDSLLFREASKANKNLSEIPDSKYEWLNTNKVDAIKRISSLDLCDKDGVICEDVAKIVLLSFYMQERIGTFGHPYRRYYLIRLKSPIAWSNCLNVNYWLGKD